jgi:hypothetical protein
MRCIVGDAEADTRSRGDLHDTQPPKPSVTPHHTTHPSTHPRATFARGLERTSVANWTRPVIGLATSIPNAGPCVASSTESYWVIGLPGVAMVAEYRGMTTTRVLTLPSTAVRPVRVQQTVGRGPGATQLHS